MPNLKRYSTTKATSLTVAMDSDDTALNLTDGSTYPDPAVGGNGQYTVIVGYGSDREEICTVTAKPSANILTVTRGQDGSVASAKNIGDIVVHGVSKRDWDDMLDKTVGGTMAADLILAGDPTSALMASTKQYVDKSMPVGAVIAYGGTAAPTGWLLCNGQATTGYTALAGVVGANVPDLRSRFIVGVGTGSGLSTYADKATGGVENVTLTAAQSGLPAHSHTNTVGNQSADHTHAIDPPATNTGNNIGDHTHGWSGTTSWNGDHTHGGYTNNFIHDVGTDGTGAYVLSQNPVTWNDMTTTGGHNHTVGGTTGGISASHYHSVDIVSFTSGATSANHNHTVTINNNTAASASSSHENRPPYYALTFIIKAF